MRTDNLPFAIASAVAIGLAQTFLLHYCWAYIAAYTPIPHWLLSLGIRGTLFYALVFAIDFLTSVVLCLPAALAIRQLRPRKLPAYLIAAVVPGFLWEYRLLFQNPAPFNEFGLREFGLFTTGILSTLLVLPAAVAVLSRVRKSVHA